MPVMLEEQETTIAYYRNDKSATVYTSDSMTMTKLDKLCAKSPEYYELVKVDTCKGEVVGKTYKVVDRTLITFRSAKVKQELTDEQRQKLRDRMIALKESHRLS